jgi:hypothetical protein
MPRLVRFLRSETSWPIRRTFVSFQCHSCYSPFREILCYQGSCSVVRALTWTLDGIAVPNSKQKEAIYERDESKGIPSPQRRDRSG